MHRQILFLKLNDLPVYIVNAIKKLFADDTTLLFTGGRLGTVILNYKN